MKDYLEIKKLLASIFDNELEVDSENDIVLFNGSEYGRPTVTLKNNILRDAYNLCSNLNVDSMQLYGDTTYEVALKSEWMPLRVDKKIELYDKDNEIKYCMGCPTYEYFVMILNTMCENDICESRIISNLRMHMKRGFYREECQDLINILTRAFRIYTLKIEIKNKATIQTFQSLTKSFEYMYMYKTRKTLVDVLSVDEIFGMEGGGVSRVSDMDEPPRRKINQEVLEYYAMALGADDPFTKYISFYHVIEYYFDEVYKKKIIEQVRDKITSPDFSYKKDKCVYDLAKFACKKMKNEDSNGKGNELESLQYVLTEYVPIEDLKKGLDELLPYITEYYSEKSVTFAGSKIKIAWNDSTSVYSNLARRIYETRNSLVHSKSDQIDKQYKPQKNKNALKKEIPLVQVISEIIIFSTSTII